MGEPHRSSPPLMLPHKKVTFERYKQFNWKHPLPVQYKKVKNALEAFELNKTPLEKTLNPEKKYLTDLYNLAVMVLNRTEELNYLLEETQILSHHNFLDPCVVKILITEMLWCKSYLKSSAEEVEAIKYYEETLREAYIKVSTIIKNPCDADKLKLPVYIRINTLSISIDDTLTAFYKEHWNLLPRCNTYADYLRILANLSGKNFIRDYHISEVLAFPPGTSFYNHPGFLKGKFLIQDKGSCLSSFLLNPKPGSVVLDACAAPGTKTNHLANIMENTGIIYANDIHPTRYEALCELLNLTNVTCAKTLENDFFNVEIDKVNVKYILIDPSCTFSGVFYEAKKNLQKLRLRRNQFTLSMILRYALQTYPNVKRVVYTTCSLYTDEGEMIVDDALKEVGDSFTLLDTKEMLWNEWDNFGVADFNCGSKCLRIVPEVDLCQGYFIAVFERNFDIPVPPYVKRFISKHKNKSGDIDEDVEKIKKVTSDEEIIQTDVPEDRLETPNQKVPAPWSKNKIKRMELNKRRLEIKSATILYKRQKQRRARKQKRKIFRNQVWKNPNLNPDVSNVISESNELNQSEVTKNSNQSQMMSHSNHSQVMKHSSQTNPNQFQMIKNSPHKFYKTTNNQLYP